MDETGFYRAVRWEEGMRWCLALISGVIEIAVPTTARAETVPHLRNVVVRTQVSPADASGIHTFEYQLQNGARSDGPLSSFDVSISRDNNTVQLPVAGLSSSRRLKGFTNTRRHRLFTGPDSSPTSPVERTTAPSADCGPPEGQPRPTLPSSAWARNRYIYYVTEDQQPTGPGHVLQSPARSR